MVIDRFLRRFAIFAIGGLVLLGGGAVFAVSLKGYHFGISDPDRQKLDQRSAMLRADAAAMLDGKPRTSAKAVTPQTIHHFGWMDPSSQGSHAFVFRNEGAAVLKLTKGETSCKCTVSSFDNATIEPGGQTEIEVTWNTGSKPLERFEQSIKVQTSDPQRPEIELKVQGSVRGVLAISSESLGFGELSLDKPATTQLTVYSQLWPSFEISELQISGDVQGLVQVETKPLAEGLLKKLHATSGYEVTATLPAGAVSGRFRGNLRIRAVPPEADDTDEAIEVVGLTDEEKDDPYLVAGEVQTVQELASATEAFRASLYRPRVRDVPIVGSVAKRLAFYGKGLDERTGFELGTIDGKEGGERRLVMRVRGDQPAKVSIGKCVPEFLKVELEPTGTKPGTYSLRIIVPPNSPPTIFNSAAEHGYITILSDAVDGGQRVLPVHGVVSGESW
jgi:hypothetical protein